MFDRKSLNNKGPAMRLRQYTVNNMAVSYVSQRKKRAKKYFTMFLTIFHGLGLHHIFDPWYGAC